MPARRAPRALSLASAACALAAAAGVVLDPRHAWAGVLAAAMFGLSIVLGAGTFVAVHGAAGATWWLPIRRVPAMVLRAWPVPAAVLAAALALGLTHLYPWADADTGVAAALSHGKARWLSRPAFLLRAAVILIAWALAIRGLLRSACGTPARNGGRPARASVAFLVVLGPTISLAWFDWAMSTEPTWATTAYGVYGFAASFQVGIAAVTLLSLGAVPDLARGAKIRHDLGQLLFAFSTFWAYIWFCQYMLIWYANLPEEVPYYARRLTPGWAPLFWISPVLCFVVPFVLLLSAKAKRNPVFLAAASITVLAGRWLDTYLGVAPARHEAPPAPLTSLAACAAVLAGMALAVRRAWGSEPPRVPPEPPLGPGSARPARPPGGL